MRNGGDRQILSGVHVVAPPKTRVGPYLHDFEGWLEQMFFDEGPQSVVFESPILPATARLETLRKLYGLAGITEKLCHRQKIPCYEANGSTVLKFFTGYGGGSREDRKAGVLAECRRTGFRPEDDNEADAIALLHYAAHRLEV